MPAVRVCTVCMVIVIVYASRSLSVPALDRSTRDFDAPLMMMMNGQGSEGGVVSDRFRRIGNYICTVAGFF